MSRRPVLLAALLLLLASPGRALTIHAALHAAGNESSQTVAVRARPMSGTAQRLEAVLAVPGNTKVDLGEALWELSIESATLWANRRVVPGDAEVTLELWPAATITGTLPKMAPPIATLSVVFAEGESTCSVDGAAWTCLVPAGVRDLRFGSTGYASVYRWAVPLRAGSTSALGTLALVRGAALSGYAATERGVDADMSDIRVTAVPRTTGATSERGVTATPNARGFFQLTALEPGEYIVSARGKTVRSEGTPVRILKDRNAEMRAPLMLDRPKRLAVAIAPPLAPDGTPWRVELLRHDVDANHLDSIAAGSAAQDGSWSHETVAGQYLLRIGEPDDSVWSSQELHVASADVVLRIDIRPLRVSGTIRLGDRPIPARVILGGRMTGAHKTAAADEEGKFSAIVPLREGDEWDVDIENDAPPVQRTVEHQKASRDAEGNLRLDIHLPSTSIAGRVVNTDGTPEAHAIVMLDATDGRETQQVFSADDGSFELFGLSSGAYRIKADGYLKTSEVLPIRVGSDETLPIELVLRDEVRVKGRVIADAAPVIGARIAAMARDARGMLIPTATSNEAGYFSLGLPPGTKTFDVIVTGFGFAATMGRAYAGERKLVTVGVERQGGRLVLRVPPKSYARLLHGGGEAAVLWILREARGSVEQQDEVDVVTLPELEQGEYQLCVDARCTAGVLAVGGSLTLTIGG